MNRISGIITGDKLILLTHQMYDLTIFHTILEKNSVFLILSSCLYARFSLLLRQIGCTDSAGGNCLALNITVVLHSFYSFIALSVVSSGILERFYKSCNSVVLVIEYMNVLHNV